MELNNFSEDLKKIYNLALEHLSFYHRTMLTSDILLLEMFKTYGTTTRYILSEYDIKAEELLEELEKLIIIHKKDQITSDLLEEIFDFCLEKANNEQKNAKIDESDVFLAFLKFKNCLANTLLENLGINTEESYLEILDMFNLEDFYNDYKEEGEYDHTLFTTNLTHSVQSGKSNPFYGRGEYISRLNEILNRKTKNNPLLIGNAGVGKSSLVEGLAKYFLEHSETEKYEILSLNLAGILAGSKYRGDFEKKLQDVLNLIEKNTHYILFIDEIHNIISAGSSEGSLDCANILKPILTKGNIKIIGATTLDEYYKYFDKDKALARRFQTIFVEEPSKEETKEILINIKAKYEEFHQIIIHTEMIDYLINEADHKIKNRKFPDKAIDVLDECLTINKIKQKKVVDFEDIDHSILKILGIKNSPASSFHFKEIEKYFLLYNLGIHTNRNNICTIEYQGTQNGMELLQKDLSAHFNLNHEMILSLDLGNYNEAFSISSLIGSPHGYIGHDEGGILYEHIVRYPLSLIILKNFQNACLEVQNLILNLTTNKEVIDRKNRKICLKNVLFIVETTSKENKSLGFVETSLKTNKTKLSFDLKIQHHQKLTAVKSYKNTILDKMKIRGYSLICEGDITEDNLNEALDCLGLLLREKKGSYSLLQREKKFYYKGITTEKELVQAN